MLKQLKKSATEWKSHPVTLLPIQKDSRSGNIRTGCLSLPYWCRGPESNRYGYCYPTDFKSVASASSATSAWQTLEAYGGGTQNRTGDEGFADLCLTAWLCRRIWSGKRGSNSRPPPWQGGALPLSYFRICGAQGRNWTADTGIFSPLLYRLSYLSKNGDLDRIWTDDLRRDRATC